MIKVGHTALSNTNALRLRGELSRTAIRDLFKHNQRAGRLDQALMLLETSGKARHEMRETGGRPEEVWLPTAAGLASGQAGGYLSLILPSDETGAFENQQEHASSHHGQTCRVGGEPLTTADEVGCGACDACGSSLPGNPGDSDESEDHDLDWTDFDEFGDDVDTDDREAAD